jgi:hypothetical protein
VQPHGNRQITQAIATSSNKIDGKEETSMRKKELKTEAKKGQEKLLNSKYWVDPMCGPVRP